MKLVSRKYNHYLNIDTEIDLLNNETFNIHVVYFINCLINENYLDWLKNQLLMINNWNINPDIHIIASIEKSKEHQFRADIVNLFPETKTYIECHYDNEYEYRGIHKVWELGQTFNSKNDIILYFHSKGIGRNKNYEQNKNDKYNIILRDIDYIIEIFSVFPNIHKAGYSSGGNGWVWFNFWFARGSYINMIEEPIKTTRRHYYEDWLARKIDGKVGDSINEKPYSYYENTLNNCYNFYVDTQNNIGNIGSYFCPNENKYFSFRTHQKTISPPKIIPPKIITKKSTKNKNIFMVFNKF